MAETAGVALVPSLYRKHGSRNWAEIRDQCTRHCDDIEFLTDDSATAMKALLASSSPASTQPIFIKSTHTESMIALVKTSISLDRHAAHPRIGRFSKAAGTVNCGHRVSEHSGMWSCMSFPSMRNFSLAHMTTRLPARKGVSNRSLYVISIRSVAVHPITNLPDQHSAENGVVASGALPRPTFSPHCTPHASSWQSSAPTYGNLDCAKPRGRLVVSTCSKPTVHPKFPQADTRLHFPSDVAHMMAEHRNGVCEARVQIPGTHPYTEWPVASESIFHLLPKLAHPARWSLATAVSAS